MSTDQIHMFMAPDAEKIQSYLVTLIDGTGSMYREYESIVKAHENVFGYLGNDQLKYQWEGVQINGKIQLFDLLPFRRADYGNISGTFGSLFEQLLAQKCGVQKNITIVFISDGQEPYNYNEISQQIELMKQKYEIQFISLAVGDQFPNTISNHLRKSIHNQNQSCPALFSVERNGDINKYEEFVEVFQKINNLLTVSNKLRVNIPVYPYLASKVTTNFIAPSEPFLTQGPITKVEIGSKQIQETKRIETLVKLTENSVKQQLVLTPSEKQENIKKAFEEIGSQATKIFESSQEKLQDQDSSYQLAANLDLISSVAYGEIDLKKLQEKQMTELQVAYKPELLYKTLDNLEEKQQLNPSFTQDQQLNKIKQQFNRIQGGCYIRSKKTNKQLDLILSIEQVVFDSLQEQKKLILGDANCNGRTIMMKFEETVLNLLKNVLTQKENQIDDKHLVIMRKINKILQLLQQIREDENSSQKFILQQIDTSLTYKNQDWQIPKFYTYDCFDKFPLEIWDYINPQKVAGQFHISLRKFIDRLLNLPNFIEKTLLNCIEKNKQGGFLFWTFGSNILNILILPFLNSQFFIILLFTDFLSLKKITIEEVSKNQIIHTSIAILLLYFWFFNFSWINFGFFIYHFYNNIKQFDNQQTDKIEFQAFQFYTLSTLKILECSKEKILKIDIYNESDLFIIEIIYLIFQLYFVQKDFLRLAAFLVFQILFNIQLEKNFQKTKIKL